MNAAFDTLLEWGGLIYGQATVIWLDGGWAMFAIAVIALVMFGLGMHVQLRLRDKGFLSVSEDTWRRWLDHPAERQGKIGRLLDELFVTVGNMGSLNAMKRIGAEIAADLLQRGVGAVIVPAT